MRIRRVWLVRNLGSNGGCQHWTLAGAERDFAQAIEDDGYRSPPLDPHSLETALHLTVLGWEIRSPWRLLQRTYPK